MGLLGTKSPATDAPTEDSTDAPTEDPTDAPTEDPTATPSVSPGLRGDWGDDGLSWFSCSGGSPPTPTGAAAAAAAEVSKPRAGTSVRVPLLLGGGFALVPLGASVMLLSTPAPRRACCTVWCVPTTPKDAWDGTASGPLREPGAPLLLLPLPLPLPLLVVLVLVVVVVVVLVVVAVVVVAAVAVAVAVAVVLALLLQVLLPLRALKRPPGALPLPLPLAALPPCLLFGPSPLRLASRELTSGESVITITASTAPAYMLSSLLLRELVSISLKDTRFLGVLPPLPPLLPSELRRTNSLLTDLLAPPPLPRPIEGGVCELGGSGGSSGTAVVASGAGADADADAGALAGVLARM